MDRLPMTAIAVACGVAAGGLNLAVLLNGDPRLLKMVVLGVVVGVTLANAYSRLAAKRSLGLVLLVGGYAVLLAVVAPAALIPMYLAQFPLFIAGLWHGTAAAAIAGTSATLLTLAAHGVLGAVLFAAVNAGPVVLLVRQALLSRREPDGTLRWYPPGLLAGWLVVFALGGMAAALLVHGGPDGLHSAVRDAVGGLLDRAAELSEASRDGIAASLAMAIPGIAAASWMLMAVINGSLAQGLVARLGANWRPSPDLTALALPGWITILFGAATAATLFGGASRYVGVNVMIALSVPFCLAGLAVLHMAVQRLSHPTAALVFFYLLAALFGWPLLAAAVLGLLETWLGLRRRLAPHGVTIDG
jgi:hypothetical protein